jgi:protein-serine/threonine kinase
LLPNPHYTNFRVHPFFRGIDWAIIHRYAAPFCPELHNPEDTAFQRQHISRGYRFFHLPSGNSIVVQPLAPANGAPPDATRDPLLCDKVHEQEVLGVRKARTFAGFTHKS